MNIEWLYMYLCIHTHTHIPIYHIVLIHTYSTHSLHIGSQYSVYGVLASLHDKQYLQRSI